MQIEILFPADQNLMRTQVLEAGARALRMVLSSDTVRLSSERLLLLEEKQTHLDCLVGG